MAQLFIRLEQEAHHEKFRAHVIIGVDQFSWKRFEPWFDPWEGWIPQGYSKIKSNLKIEPGFLSYDYSPLTFVSNSHFINRLKIQSPLSLKDLVTPEWKRNFILEDPRTSLPGLIFLLFTKKILGSAFLDYWKKLSQQWLILSPSWTGAFHLFQREEAPLVWSYSTSQAYPIHSHLHSSVPSPSTSQMIENPSPPLVLKEGQPVQIEGAILIKGAFKNQEEKKLAHLFLEFLIAPEVQELIPLKNWMMPVQPEIPLPVRFKSILPPAQVVALPVGLSEIETTLKLWNQNLRDSTVSLF